MTQDLETGHCDSKFFNHHALNFKDIPMTLTQTTAHDNAPSTTVQSHHLKAAEHLALASKSHKDAAKLIDAGDHNGAAIQSKLAVDHAEQATKHTIQLAKRTAAVASSKK